VPVSSRIAGIVISVAVIVSLVAGALYVWPGYLAATCSPSVVLDGRAYCSEKVALTPPEVVVFGRNKTCLNQYIQVNGTPAVRFFGSYEFIVASPFWCGLGGFGVSLKVWEPDGSHSAISVGPSGTPYYQLHPINWTTADNTAGFVWISNSTNVTLVIEARPP